MEEKVLFYSEHDQLSNFYREPFIWQGKEWQSAEHAYQAAKFFNTDLAIAETIRTALTPAEAKLLSKKHRDQRDPNWTEQKLVVMEDILRAKLRQDEPLRAMLIATGECELIEDSPDDGYWGRGSDGRGENHLGKLWMKLRSELQNDVSEDGTLKQ